MGVGVAEAVLIDDFQLVLFAAWDPAEEHGGTVAPKLIECGAPGDGE